MRQHCGQALAWPGAGDARVPSHLGEKVQESCSSLRGSWLNRKELIRLHETGVHPPHLSGRVRIPDYGLPSPSFPSYRWGNGVPWENPGSESHGCSEAEDWSRLLQFSRLLSQQGLGMMCQGQKPSGRDSRQDSLADGRPRPGQAVQGAGRGRGSSGRAVQGGGQPLQEAVLTPRPEAEATGNPVATWALDHGRRVGCSSGSGSQGSRGCHREMVRGGVDFIQGGARGGEGE